MSEQNVAITVVVPSYNSASTIRQCLDSVFSQTFQDFEILIIDDGSTDQSAEMIEGIMRRPECSGKLKLVKQANAGPSAARNKGIAMARGKFLAFLDADDYWASDKLALQMKYIALHPELGMLGVASAEPIGGGTDTLTMISFTQLLSRNYFKTSGVLIRRTLAEKFPFNEKMKYSEDYRVWLQIARESPVAMINKNLCAAIGGKRAFGDAGLSANLAAMQQGELSNYRFLFEQNHISFAVYLKCMAFSNVKYIRRVLLTYIK